jgi:hypothetical protein
MSPTGTRRGRVALKAGEVVEHDIDRQLEAADHVGPVFELAVSDASGKP